MLDLVLTLSCATREDSEVSKAGPPRGLTLFIAHVQDLRVPSYPTFRPHLTHRTFCTAANRIIRPKLWLIESDSHKVSLGVSALSCQHLQSDTEQGKNNNNNRFVQFYSKTTLYLLYTYL